MSKAERNTVNTDDYRMERMLDNFDFDFRCVSIGIIKAFDKDKQTVEVRLVTDEYLIDGANPEEPYKEQPPLLVDVPIYMPRAGGFALTMPVKVDDECIVLFNDNCFDDWFANGGDEKVPMDGRRHDIADGIALIGIWNQTRTFDEYSTDAIEIRNDDGTTKITVKDDSIKIKVGETYLEVKDGEINIDSTTTTINIKNTGNIDIESDGIVNVKGSQVILADGVQGVARLGDTVAVTVDPTSHSGSGTITGASSKVLAG
jgi:hypothetical protein